jgi:hypothetical protein
VSCLECTNRLLGRGADCQPNPVPQNLKNFIWDQVIVNKGSLNYCVRIDQAGSATTVTDFDGWMLRQLWYKFVKARYGY